MTASDYAGGLISILLSPEPPSIPLYRYLSYLTEHINITKLPEKITEKRI